jgi:hypothetical protein
MEHESKVTFVRTFANATECVAMQQGKKILAAGRDVTIQGPWTTASSKYAAEPKARKPTLPAV